MSSEQKQQVLPLKASNVDKYSDKVQKPKYDRSQVGAAWIHLGVGAFHRAHQCVYQDELLSKNGPTEWGIYGMSLLKNDTLIRDVLGKQDHLYTVLERTPEIDTAKIIGSIQNFNLVPDKMEESIEQLASEHTKIVSMTITESGYAVDEATQDLDTKLADIKHDISQPDEAPYSTYGFLAASLLRRKQRGLKPYTLMTCDNIQHNGKVLQKMLLKFLSLVDQDLYEWVKEHGAFPNTMVDRITPAFSKENIEIVRKEYGIEDAWPIACEPFKQWVIEDHFTLGRPKWEEVQVQMVDSVDAFEKLKLGILNVSHIAVAFYSKICTYVYMDEALHDILLSEFVRGIQNTEVSPLLDPVPGINIERYKDIVIKRIENSAVKDTVQRVSSDGTGKFTKFLYPILHEAINKNSKYDEMTFIVACWCRLLTGSDTFGNEFQISDPNADRLHAAAMKGGKNPGPLLENTDIFGDLKNKPKFVKLLSEQLADIHENGIQNALENLLKRQPERQ